MNPFTWPGERFIVAYLILAVMVLAACYLVWRRSGQGAKPAKVNDLTADPYRIAYLRNGWLETARVAVVNLVDRGILGFDGTNLHAVRSEAIESLRRPLDRVIVKICRNPTTLVSVIANDAVRKAAEEYAEGLGAQGLVSDGPEFDLRKKIGWAAVGLLAGVAIGKILYATYKGYGNLGFLVFAAIVATVWAFRIARRRQTYVGKQMLDSVRTLMGRLRDNADRIKPGGATNEALLLAATFGIYALPAAVFPIVHDMFPPPKSSGSSDSDSSDGGSSCSSSCGGGGGCGGCGS